MTKVNDTLVLNVPKRVFSEPLHVTICPDYKGKYLAIELKFHGFRRAAVVNPNARDTLTTYEWVIEFADKWLFTDFGYTRCQISTAY